MTERDIREAAQMNDHLGKQVVSRGKKSQLETFLILNHYKVTKLYSKNFQHREDAIQEVSQNLTNFQGDKEEAKLLMRASAILIAKMIKDNVFSVFNNALKLLSFLLNDYNRKHGIGKTEVIYVIDRCLPPLLHRTGDTNARLRQRAHEFITEMSVYSDVKPLHAIPNHCTLPMKPHCAPRLALSRVEIVSDLITKLGTKDNGLNIENVCKFCAYALEHNSGDVRELATKIIIQMYKDYGNSVRKYIPQDNEMNRRNKKYRIIYEAFDRIDGKPVQAEDKVNNFKKITECFFILLNLIRLHKNSLKKLKKWKPMH
jgi:centrosomal protein CEP104